MELHNEFSTLHTWLRTWPHTCQSNGIWEGDNIPSKYTPPGGHLFMYIRESMLQICSNSVNPQNESPFWKTERKSIFGSVQDVHTVEYGSNKRTGHQPCSVPLLCPVKVLMIWMRNYSCNPNECLPAMISKFDTFVATGHSHCHWPSPWQREFWSIYYEQRVAHSIRRQSIQHKCSNRFPESITRPPCVTQDAYDWPTTAKLSCTTNMNQNKGKPRNKKI